MGEEIKLTPSSDLRRQGSTRFRCWREVGRGEDGSMKTILVEDRGVEITTKKRRKKFKKIEISKKNEKHQKSKRETSKRETSLELIRH